MSRKRSSSRRRNHNRPNRGGRGNRNNEKVTRQITQFIQQAGNKKPQEKQSVEVNRDFSQFDLDFKLKNNIQAMGFKKPTPIQDKSFNPIMKGKDVLGIANTGTGKTGAFLIPLIQKASPHNRAQKILVITPTRELAGQIHDSFKKLASGLDLYSVRCIGGTNIRRQISDLSRRHHAVIGTPGRILDLIGRGEIKPKEFSFVVLDEVDRMLDMGFVNDIRKILKDAPQGRQHLFFSATTSKEVKKIMNEFSNDLVKVSVKTTKTTHLITQDIVSYEHPDKKLDTLHKILNSEEVTKALVFGRTKWGVKKLMSKLQKRGFKTESIHGNKTQNQRRRALEAFKKDKVSVLVATDVAARGLDIDDVSHVINYEVPDTFDDYIHRIGRTGRSGSQGTAYTFIQ